MNVFFPPSWCIFLTDATYPPEQLNSLKHVRPGTGRCLPALWSGHGWPLVNEQRLGFNRYMFVAPCICGILHVSSDRVVRKPSKCEHIHGAWYFDGLSTAQVTLRVLGALQYRWLVAQSPFHSDSLGAVSERWTYQLMTNRLTLRWLHVLSQMCGWQVVKAQLKWISVSLA